MPNWVDNTLVVTGDEQEVQRFAERASKKYSRKYLEFTPDGMEWVDDEQDQPLSFWNFVRPDESILHEYWGDERKDLSLEERLQHKTNHWYDWNIRNWGCKWDAKVMDANIEGGCATYAFDTAWSPPQEFLQAIVKQFPDLDFNLRFVEEQGWGGELDGSGGQLFKVAEWDIPCTHKERMEYIGYCSCEEMRDDEVEWMYEDCPRKKELANA